MTGVGTDLNQIHPLKPREITKKKVWEISEPDQSFIILEFLKQISIQTCWKQIGFLKSKKTQNKTPSDSLRLSPSVKIQGAD